MTIIAVSGTPGTGKTTTAKQLTEELGYAYIDGKEVIRKHQLDKAYDEGRDCTIIDIDQFADAMKDTLKKYGNAIIDSHLSHELPADMVDIIIITTCKRPTLKRRLEKRGYAAAKVQENIEAEIFDVCYQDALASGHKHVIKIDTTDTSVKELAEQIKERITSLGLSSS
jgi:adenylate kinase